MRENYDPSLDLVLHHEGGFVNHPKDPGGATNKGVTQGVYNSYRRNKGLSIRSVKFIEDHELDEIYRLQYWDAVQGDRLPAGIDYMVFDYAVNSGPSRAVKDLQRLLKVGVDGVLGNVTLEAVQVAADNDEEGLIHSYCEKRMSFLKGLKTFGTFGKGWKRRVMGDRDGFQEGDRGVVDLATMMARHDLAYPIPEKILPAAIGTKSGEVSGKGLEQDQAKLKTKEGLGAAISASGITSQSVLSVADQVKPNIGDSLFGQIALAIFILISVAGAALFLWGFWKRYQESSNRIGGEPPAENEFSDPGPLTT